VTRRALNQVVAPAAATATGWTAPPELARARRRHVARTTLAALGFLAPALVCWAFFMLVPSIWVLRQSFMKGGVLGPAQWVGLHNWSSALGDTEFVGALKTTLLYAAIYVPALLILALALALVLREVRRGASVARTLIYLPSLTPVVLSALLWLFIVHPDFGLLNLGVRAVGAQPINWLGEQQLALPTIAMTNLWRDLGFFAVLLLAGLVGIAGDLYGAAALDGASAWQRFRHVTLPGLRPTLVVAAVLAVLTAMQVFDAVVILTFGGPANATDTAVFFIYKTVFESADPGLGAVLSIILLVLILAMTQLVMRFGRERRGAR
jgi:ABC-type sugar transport system permease subunit